MYSVHTARPPVRRPNGLKVRTFFFWKNVLKTQHNQCHLVVFKFGGPKHQLTHSVCLLLWSKTVSDRIFYLHTTLNCRGRLKYCRLTDDHLIQCGNVFSLPLSNLGTHDRIDQTRLWITHCSHNYYRNGYKNLSPSKSWLIFKTIYNSSDGV